MNNVIQSLSLKIPSGKVTIMYSPDRQIIKLPFDQLIFAATAFSLKPRGRMTTAITFSRQNDAGSSARTTQLSFSYVCLPRLGL